MQANPSRPQCGAACKPCFEQPQQTVHHADPVKQHSLASAAVLQSLTPCVCRLVPAEANKRHGWVPTAPGILPNPAATLCLQIQFGTATAEHDLTVKLRKAKELLDKGHKVKCNVRFKPPLWQGQAQARAVMDSISERMAGAALVEPPAPTEKQERTCLYFYLNPVSAGSAPAA